MCSSGKGIVMKKLFNIMYSQSYLVWPTKGIIKKRLHKRNGLFRQVY